jgi:hypothetical protein
MKAQLKMITLITILFAGSSVLAESVVSKPATRIDFNKMIEENNVKRNDLQQDINRDASTAQAPTKRANAKKDDKSKTIDFIDVEIGVGQTPSVVDRRFDSISDAQIVDVDSN